MGRAFGRVDIPVDNPSSTLSGEAFLQRVYDAYRGATSETGTNVWNTALLIGWDEPGGTYDHVPPGPVPPPDPSAGPGEMGFMFDRSGYRVPAILVSPWVESGAVHNDEYRHTSLIATLRKKWGLGDAFSQRDASARTFEHLFTLDTPRDPKEWVSVTARSVPAWTLDDAVVGKSLSTLGIGAGQSLFTKATSMGIELPDTVQDSAGAMKTDAIMPAMRLIANHFFPLLSDAATNQG
jgi:phospholipase C